MNTFEFEDINNIKQDLVLDNRCYDKKIIKFDEYSKFNDCTNIEVYSKNGIVTCRECSVNNAKLILICFCPSDEFQDCVINLYSLRDSIWIHTQDIYLTQLLSGENLRVVTVDFYNYFSSNDVLFVVFRSQKSLHVARIDIGKNTLTDIMDFHSESVFIPQSETVTDCIISPNNFITLLLVDQIGTNNTNYCPTVAELNLVLSRRLLSGLRSLLSFWTTQITDITQMCTMIPPAHLNHGIPIIPYITFLYIHQKVMLHIITIHCHNDTSIIFLEHITNMINDYLNVVLNILLSLPSFSHNTSKFTDIIGGMVVMLCDYGRIFRDLLLQYRPTLAVYQRLSVTRPVTKITKEERFRHSQDEVSLRAMDNSKILVAECLKTRRIASMQIYSMQHSGGWIQDDELSRQSELAILSSVQTCDWTDLNGLVIRLGYEPIETLTALCKETKLKEIRDYLYRHLDLDKSESAIKFAKNVVDQLESAYTVQINDINDSSFRGLFTNGCGTDNHSTHNYDHVRGFVEGLDKSKCRDLRQTLLRGKHDHTKLMPRQLIDINMNTFVDILDRSGEDDAKLRILEAIELCLIDADYRKLLMETKGGSVVPQYKLKILMYKWRKNVPLFVRYVTESCDVELLKSVIDIDITADNVLVTTIIDQLMTMVCGPQGGRHTDVDRVVAKAALTHILMQYPELLIVRLEHLYGADIASASDVVMEISDTAPVHVLCQVSGCGLKRGAVKESLLLTAVGRIWLERIVANTGANEFPIVFYYLLKDIGLASKILDLSQHLSIRKAALLHSVVTNRLAVDSFNCLISRDITVLNEHCDTLTIEELDEVAYTAFLSGITYNDMMESSDATVISIRKLLSAHNYWYMLKTRPLRPSDRDGKTSNIEQYYEVNLYTFLHRSGIPLPLDTMFTNQPLNTFASKGKDGNHTAPMQLIRKTSAQNEHSKDKLNYIYYLTLGRPFQAFCCIENEFTISGKPGCLQLDIMKDLVKSIYQVALSHLGDRLVIGACFALLRLIGSSTELLRCYLTLIRWVIDWHVQVNGQSQLSESTQAQLTEPDIRAHYTTKTIVLFKFCLSNNSGERKSSRDLLIRQLEEIFVWRLNNGYYSEIKTILPAWNLVLYFCQMHGSPFSTAILQYYASKDQWLLFLCMAQVFGYSKDQAKEALNQFKDISIRYHMTYIVSKVDEISQQSQSTLAADGSKMTSDPFNRLNVNLSGNVTRMPTNLTGNSETFPSSESNPIKDFLSFKQKNYNRYALSTLTNSAKNNLFELIFDCQMDANNRSDMFSNRNKACDIRLNTRKLLAYCLALGHPFLSVLAFSSNDYPGDTLDDSSTANKLDIFRNCVSCFIVSSAPKKVQETIWSKWSGLAKLDWSEDDLIDLVVFAIENGFTNVVHQAFSVLKADKFSSVAAFFGMLANASKEGYNPVLRNLFLTEFVADCRMNSAPNTVKDRHRGKLVQNRTVTFVSKLLGTSLLAALQVSEKVLGPRILQEWLMTLSSTGSGIIDPSVKSLFPFSETNVSLLSLVLAAYFDFIDLDASSQMTAQFQKQPIPVNTRSKEFMQFVENLTCLVLEKLNTCYDYTRVALAESTLALVEHINSLHSVQLPSNHEKWKTNELQIRSLLVRKLDSNLVCQESLADLVSMALAGQVDKLEAVSLCTSNDSKCSLTCIENPVISGTDSPTKSHGSSHCWRRLIIPEDWQDKILNLQSCTSADHTEKTSRVSSLLNESKWIEACRYMIEHNFVVNDALLIWTSMKVASGRMDPAKLPVSIKEYCQSKYSDIAAGEPVNRLQVRRRSMLPNSSASKLSLVLSSDSDSNKNLRPSRSGDVCQQFLTKIAEILIHGQGLMEYISTIHCIATRMSESYLSVANGEEFDVLTKILVGACRDKIDTADMYLGVVDIDTDQLCSFIAEVIVQVLRLEIQTFIGSTSVMVSTPLSTSPKHRLPFFGLSPPGPDSSKSSRSSSPNALSRRSGTTVHSQNSALSLHENILRVAERCQIRSEWKTVPLSKVKPESRLMKAFTLQDILVLSPNSKKLGKILFLHYQRFSQEVSGCNEDAEFLVYLLIQCHNCFTDGGDTIGISNCLKAAKELTKLLNSNGYYVLMAQLLCRIGRYGEMPYIFSYLIENHEFETLFRKDMDKDGVIVPYIFDYLNRYHSDDYEKIEMVCLKYSCYYELAETKSKIAANAIVKLREYLAVGGTVRDTARMMTSSIVNSLLHASKNYLRAGCYKKMEEHFRKAQFYKLQQRWLEDPDKTFSVGAFNRPLSSKVTLPETGLPYGIRIISLNSEQALSFLKRIPNFYTAYLMHDQLKLSSDVWADLLMQHALINGDKTYLQHYLLFFGAVISCNLIQQCLHKLDRSAVKLSSKDGLSNLKTMLTNCDDVFFAKRISDTYKLTT